MKINGLIKLMLMLFFAAALTESVLAQQTKDVKYNISPQSKLFIDGSSTLHSFKINAKKISGTLAINNDSGTNVNGIKISQLKVVIPVKKLDSEKESMNENMDDALKADKNPDITYILNNINTAELPEDSAKAAVLKASGTLTIAGVSQDIQMDIEGYRTADGTLHFAGEKKINMVDYGVTPPTMFFGTIKVSKDVNVHFNLALTAQKDILGSK